MDGKFSTLATAIEAAIPSIEDIVQPSGLWPYSLVTAPDARAAVAQELRSLSETRDLEQQWLATNGGFAVIQLDALVDLLAGRARLFGAEHVIDELLGIASQKTCVAFDCLALTGVQVNQTVRINHQIRLEPISFIAGTEYADIFRRRMPPVLYGTVVEISEPHALLVREREHELIVNKQPADSDDRRNVLLPIAAALVLATHGLVETRALWTRYEDGPFSRTSSFSIQTSSVLVHKIQAVNRVVEESRRGSRSKLHATQPGDASTSHDPVESTLEGCD